MQKEGDDLNVVISGEFENIDYAEMCANRIRHSCTGIKNAVVRSKRNEHYAYDSPVMMSPGQAYALNSYSGVVVPMERVNRNHTEVEEKQITQLEITADESAYRQVSSLFTACGALHVHRV